MRQTIRPAARLSGLVTLPGDKSISHRCAMIASLAEGPSKIASYSTGADCHSTLGCVRALGIEVEEQGTTVTIQGRGLNGWTQPQRDLDAGNSGSTIRMMSGLLAAQPFTSRIFGDESLSRRPMGRVIKPLEQMGARIEARESQFPPLVIHGSPLHPIDYTLPVPSAQVKTCVLFGGLFADGTTIVRESIRSRDHTEIALREFGADLQVSKRVITLQGRPQTHRSRHCGSQRFILGGILSRGGPSDPRLPSCHPECGTESDAFHTARLPALDRRCRESSARIESGERRAHRRYRSETFRSVRGGTIDKELTAALIDEIPVLAVLGAASEEGIVISDAQGFGLKRPTASRRSPKTSSAWASKSKSPRTGCACLVNKSFARRRSIRSAIIASPWHSRSRRSHATANRPSRTPKPRRFHFRSSGTYCNKLPDSFARWLCLKTTCTPFFASTGATTSSGLYKAASCRASSTGTIAASSCRPAVENRSAINCPRWFRAAPPLWFRP